MRHTEFWRRREDALGSSYARAWADQHRITELGCTVEEALASGVAPKRIWAAVWRTLELPDRDR